MTVLQGETLTRARDGLRFEPTFAPPYTRCEACLALVLPQDVERHVCEDWWSMDQEKLEAYFKRMSTPANVQEP